MKTLIFNGSPRTSGDTESLINIVREGIPGECRVINTYRCNILIASPIYFSELTGKLLDVGSRLQTYFCATSFRGEKPIPKSKRGAVILVGGGDGHMDKAYETACTLLHHMNCYHIHEAVVSHNTNERPAVKDQQALIGVRSIVRFFRNEEWP